MKVITKQLWHRFFSSAQSCVESGIHLLWPERCLICAESILLSDDGLCTQCWTSLSKAISADYCRHCGRTVSPYGIIAGKCGHCQELQFEFDGIVRVGEYESTLRSLVLAFKFSEKTELSERLARMLKQAFEASGFDSDIEMIVPVPLHWRRKLRRGYNQAHLLAKAMKLKTLPVCSDLVRVRNTEQQWSLTGPQRRRNVKGAFSVRKGHTFAGKHIALVDDITTSGATLGECAKVLKEAGAHRVISAVLATAYHD